MIPQRFICPLSHKIMKDPVWAIDGFIYERKAIEALISEQKASPVSNVKLTQEDLLESASLKKEIVGFVRTICRKKELLDVVIQPNWLDVLEIYLEGGEDLTDVAFQAISMGNLAVVSALFQKKSTDGAWIYSLMQAIQSGDEYLAILKFLFEQGIKYSNEAIVTFIARAAKFGDEGKPEIFNYLMGIVKDINVKDEYGKTVLHHAPFSTESSLDVAKMLRFLVQQGADICAVDDDNQTAFNDVPGESSFQVLYDGLMEAVKAGRIEPVKATKLLTELFLHYLQKHCFIACAWILKNNVELAADCLEAALKEVVRVFEPDDVVFIKLLITAGIKTKSQAFSLVNLIHLNLPLEILRHRVENCGAIDLEIKDGIEGTALCIAAAKGRLEVVEDLLARGAKPQACDINGNNLLHFAIMQGWGALVQRLINSGMNPELANNDGCTPLILAVIHKKSDILQYLLDRKVDLEAYSPLYGTALSAALMFGNIPLAKLLVDRKAKPKIKNKFGNTPFHLIAANNPSTLIVYDINFIMRHFLAEQGDLFAKNFAGETFHHILSKKNMAPHLRNLLARKHLIRKDVVILEEKAASKEQLLGERLRIGVSTICYEQNQTSLEHFPEQKVAAASSALELFNDAPLATKHSRKVTGFNFSVITTPEQKSFLLLPGKEKLLGNGEFGKVKQAIDVSSQRRLAVKIINVPNDSAVFSGYLENEINALKKLGRFVACYTIKSSSKKMQKKIYIFEELLPGANLAASMQQISKADNILHILHALRVMLSIATDLFRLHKQGLAHLDLAPRNIVHDPTTAECRLVDFNISVPFESWPYATATDHYFPESGTKIAEPCNDIYLLGTILKEILSFDQKKDGSETTNTIYRELRSLAELMNNFSPSKRPSLIQCIQKLLALYDQVKQHCRTPVDITISDYRMTPSFLLFLDLMENLPASSCNLRRCEDKSESLLPTVRFEYVLSDQDSALWECAEDKEQAEGKRAVPPSLFFQPAQVASSEPKTHLARIFIHLNFDGSIQLFKPVSGSDSKQLIDLQNMSLEINMEGKLRLIRTDEKNPDIAMQLFNSMKRFPQDVSTPSLCPR